MRCSEVPTLCLTWRRKRIFLPNITIELEEAKMLIMFTKVVTDVINAIECNVMF